MCYSAYLSERDHKDFEDVFKHFGVNEMVTYGTFQQLSEKLINEEGDVRTMTLDVILNSKESRVLPARISAKKRILLVDEVDVFSAVLSMEKHITLLSRCSWAALLNCRGRPGP